MDFSVQDYTCGIQLLQSTRVASLVKASVYTLCTFTTRQQTLPLTRVLLSVTTKAFILNNGQETSQLIHVLLLVIAEAFTWAAAIIPMAQPELTTVRLEIMGLLVTVEVLYIMIVEETQ